MTTLEAVKQAAERDPEGAYRAAGFSGDLTPDGPSRLKGLCPLHQENTPSFKIHTDGDMRGRWWCYGACGRGGSIVDLYMARYRVTDLNRVVKELAHLLGVNGDMPRTPKQRHDRQRKTAPPLPIPPATADRLHGQLLDAPERLAWLVEKKGLTREIIERAKLGWDPTCGRYAIPIPSANGQPGYADIRKYLPNAPKDAEKMLAWERGRGSTKLYPWPWVCGERELVLTEGEIDALNLIARDIPAFTATNGKGHWPNDPPDLAGKTVWVCGDADDAGRKHNETMPAKLYAAGAEEVRVIEWPEDAPKGSDVSDCFAQGGTTEEFRALMDAAPVVPRSEARILSESPSPDAYFDRDRFVAKRLADQLRSESRFGWLGGALHVYQKGVYRPQAEGLIRPRVQALLGEQHTRRRADEVVYDIQTAAPRLDGQANMDTALVNVANGLLRWETGDLEPHNPDHISTIQLPVVYDPEAMGDGTLDRYLQTTLVDGEGHPYNVPLIEEFTGYCLIPSTKLEKALCALGGGKNGKGTYIRLLQALLGERNVSTVPLQEIAQHKFKRADLFGSLANVFADLDQRALRSTGYFKAIVSGDSIDAERKYGHPFSFRPFARLIFSANRMPAADDPTYAYHRRWIILPFPNRFEGKERCDTDLASKLAAPSELSYLFNRAIAGLRRLWVRGEFTVPPTAAVALGAYRLTTDSVAAFVGDACTVHRNARVKKQALFDAYCEWCQRSRLDPVVQGEFNTRLQGGYAVRERHLRWSDSGRTRSWGGIGLAADSNTVASLLPDEEQPVAAGG